MHEHNFLTNETVVLEVITQQKSVSDAKSNK